MQFEADGKKGEEDNDKFTGLKRGKSMEDQNNRKNQEEIQMKKPKIKDTIEPGERGESIKSKSRKVEAEHRASTQMERDKEVLGGERIRKYLSEKGKRCDTYKSLITNISENKKKEEIEAFDMTHPSRKYRTVWEYLGVSETGNLVMYKKTRLLIPRAARKSIIMLAHNEHTGTYGVSNKI